MEISTLIGKLRNYTFNTSKKAGECLAANDIAEMSRLNDIISKVSLILYFLEDIEDIEGGCLPRQLKTSREAEVNDVLRAIGHNDRDAMIVRMEKLRAIEAMMDFLKGLRWQKI